MRKKILSLGNCSYDHGRLVRLFDRYFQAEVFAVRHTEEAVQRMRAERFDLVLVNRVFHGSEQCGLEAIRLLKADPDLSATPVMLLSNYEKYQAEALAAGAVPGFGKHQLDVMEPVESVRRILA